MHLGVRLVQLVGGLFETVLRCLQVGQLGRVAAVLQDADLGRLEGEPISDQARLVGVQDAAAAVPDLDPHEPAAEHAGTYQLVGRRDGSPTAITATDQLVRARVLSGWLVRVKIWDSSGRILYSDEPRLIGDRFALEPTEVGILQHGGDAAELSDLKAPENRFEKASNKLYETYAQVHSPEGTPLL